MPRPDEPAVWGVFRQEEVPGPAAVHDRRLGCTLKSQDRLETTRHQTISMLVQGNGRGRDRLCSANLPSPDATPILVQFGQEDVASLVLPASSDGSLRARQLQCPTELANQKDVPLPIHSQPIGVFMARTTKLMHESEP